jgi:hypothetical protein
MGYVTDNAKYIAVAASAALPPCESMAAPARTASASSPTTKPATGVSDPPGVVEQPAIARAQSRTVARLKAMKSHKSGRFSDGKYPLSG